MLVCLAVVTSSAAAGGESLRAAERARPVSAAAIGARLRAGRVVQLYDVTIRGNLDLRSADVRGGFRCELCVFDGDIDASAAVFRQSFSLDRSHVKGSLYFRGARFEHAVSIGAEAYFVDVSTDVQGVADFSLTSFASTANFSSLHVIDPADFTQASFQGQSVFNSSVF